MPDLLAFIFYLLLGACMLIGFGNLLRSRDWIRTNAEIVDATVDIDNDLIVKYSFLVSADGVGNDQTCQKYFGSGRLPGRTLWTKNQREARIKATLALKKMDVWYARDSPLENFIYKPDNSRRAFQGVVGIIFGIVSIAFAFLYWPFGRGLGL